MSNIEMKTSGSILTITVDLAKSCGRSKSGKSEIIATTSGNKPLPGYADIKIGLNIYK